MSYQSCYGKCDVKAWWWWRVGSLRSESSPFSNVVGNSRLHCDSSPTLMIMFLCRFISQHCFCRTLCSSLSLKTYQDHLITIQLKPTTVWKAPSPSPLPSTRSVWRVWLPSSYGPASRWLPTWRLNRPASCSIPSGSHRFRFPSHRATKLKSGARVCIRALD